MRWASDVIAALVNLFNYKAAFQLLLVSNSARRSTVYSFIMTGVAYARRISFYLQVILLDILHTLCISNLHHNIHSQLFLVIRHLIFTPQTVS
jgi:hypothetical protein